MTNRKKATTKKKATPAKKKKAAQKATLTPPLTSTKRTISRLTIKTSEIEQLTGLTQRTAQRMLEEIRAKKGKGRHALVTIQEFAEHVKLDPKEVRKSLGL